MAWLWLAALLPVARVVGGQRKACGGANVNVSALYPNFHVLGFQKCGTSYVHHLIVSHPLVQQAGPHKEFCFSPENLRKLHKKTASKPYSSNACIHGLPQLVSHKCIWPALNFQPKYVVLVRQPAEYLWARYNLWTLAMDSDIHPYGGQLDWTNNKTYRPPEMFHELVVAGDRVAVDSRINMRHFGTHVVEWWLHEIVGMIEAVGSPNLLVLDIGEAAQSSFRARLAAFLGLGDPSSFKLPKRMHVNSGGSFAARGANSRSEGPAVGGLYEVSGRRPMLARTRALINQRERPACVEMAARFSVDLRCG
jgi:hypothetical protein